MVDELYNITPFPDGFSLRIGNTEVAYFERGKPLDENTVEKIKDLLNDEAES